MNTSRQAIENDDSALLSALAAYVPMDRRQSLARGPDLPPRSRGAVLFADISGFTPLTEAFMQELGSHQGAEELTRNLNMVYDALIDRLHEFGGCAVGFSGDAITCWFDGDDGGRAVTCAFEMLNAIQEIAAITLPSGRRMPLQLKVVIVTGAVQRIVAGDPEIQLIDVLAGPAIDSLAMTEPHAQPGRVIVDRETATAMGDRLVVEASDDGELGEAVIVTGMREPVAPQPWPALPGGLSPEMFRPWLLHAVYDRLCSGAGDFLTELRPATTLFVHFAVPASAASSEHSDQLNDFLRRVQAIVAEHGGTLLQITIGDKGSYLSAAFGAPEAHENDAERALAAALALQRLPDQFAAFGPLKFGVSAGRMRTGAYGGQDQRIYGVHGDDVNVAARLMQLAEPGEILITRGVRDAAGETFRWQELPPQMVKGKTEPIEVYRCIGVVERPARSSRRGALPPLIGRTEDLATARELLDRTLDGQGQILAIAGEAGIGKSRLIAAIEDIAWSRSMSSHSGECSSYNTNTGYVVWQPIWRELFGLTDDQPVLAQIRHVERELESLLPGSGQRVPLLGPLLDIAIPDNELTAPFDAKLRKESMESLLVDWLRLRSERQPLLLVLEDCHRIDSLSLDLFEALGRAISNYPVMIVMSYRPFQLAQTEEPRVSRLPHYTEITLGELNDDETMRLAQWKLEQLLGPDATVSKGFLERTTARAAGNPFYVEELLNYLVSQRLISTGTSSLDRVELPDSLHSLILSRIDRLEERQKTTIKVASVVGRQFRPPILWGSYPPVGTPEEVATDLGMLCRFEFIVQDAQQPEPAYAFRHLVTQEAAYSTLAFSLRAQLHNLVGHYLESRDPGQVDLLAFHFDRSENTEKRIEYLLKAGKNAQAAYANEAAIDYYERVLPLLPQGEQIPVLLRLGQVLELVGRWDDAGERYEQAVDLASDQGNSAALADCRAAMGELLRKRGRYDEAGTWFALAREGYESIGDRAGIGRILHQSGTLAAQTGSFDQAQADYEASLAIRRELDSQPDIASLLSNLGILARFRGDHESARALHTEALEIRRGLGDRWAIANSLNNLGNVALDQGRLDEAREYLEEAVTLGHEIGDRWALANSLNNLGNVVRAQGDLAGARRLYAESLTINSQLGDHRAIAYLLEDIAGLAIDQRDYQRAFQLVGAAARLRQEQGTPLSPNEEMKLNQTLAPARDALGSLATAYEAEGRALTLDQALDKALASDPDPEGTMVPSARL